MVHPRLLRTVASVFLGLALLGGAAGAGEGRGSTPAPRIWGVNAHVPSSQDLRDIRRAGFGWARVDLTWNWVEPEPGTFRWGEVDRLLASARREGVELLGVLGYCPPWASSGPDAFYPPRDNASWKNYVRCVVGRCRGQVRRWILWNEPNCGTYFRGTPEDYIERVLVPGRRAMREADPEALLCGPDLAHLAGCDWSEWMGRVLATHGDRFDIISHHCYKETPEAVLRQLEGPKWFWEPPPVRELLRRHGQDAKPFLLTETGWRSTKVGERAQAENLARMLELASDRPWLGGVFLYELKDSPIEPGYGLLRQDGSRKPSYRAVKGALRRLAAGGEAPRYRESGASR